MRCTREELKGEGLRTLLENLNSTLITTFIIRSKRDRGPLKLKVHVKKEPRMAILKKFQEKLKS